MKIDSLWSFANFDVIKKILWFIQAYFFCRETYIYFICIFLMLYKILYYSLFFIYTYSEHNKNCKNSRDNIKNTKKKKTYFSLAIVHVKAINIVYC